jgi:ribosome-binding protein aMBF1 (putative translation factor)
MFTEKCEICGNERSYKHDFLHYIHTDEGYFEVCEECYTKHMTEEARSMAEEQKRLENKRKKMADDKTMHLVNLVAVLNGVIVKEKAKRAKIERKYNRYYHLVEDFYAYLLRIGEVKEFTLFHEEREIKREAEGDGRSQMD